MEDAEREDGARAIRLAGSYHAKNLVASTPDEALWLNARTAEDLYSNGIYVQFSYPNEVQYLKLVNV